MRCGKVRKGLLEAVGEPLPAEFAAHVATCPACASYARDWQGLQTGLKAMAAEPVPEPSVGFAVRLVRSFQQAAADERAVEVFLERVGRRFVSVALLAALLLALGLLVPRSGPVYSISAADTDPAQPEAVAAQTYPVFSGQLLDGSFEFAPQAGGR
jgi:anti-sigma factor RsiW